MILTKKGLGLINNLVSGIAIIVLGLIITIGGISTYERIIKLLVSIFLIFGLSKLLNFFISKKIVRNKQVLFKIIIDLVFAILLIIFPKISFTILPFLFSMYMLLNSMINFIDYVILKSNNLRGRFKNLLFFLMFFLLSLTFFLYPLKKLGLFIKIVGVYCVLLGINRVVLFVLDIVTDKFKMQFKKKLKLTLPIFLEAFIPISGLKNLNKHLDYFLNLDEKNDENSDLKIFMHLSNHGFNQFGHMDIMFEDKIYSYGNYDKSSQKLFTTIGDGVLFELNKKEEYIDFCIRNSKKTIIEYGIKLTDSQKKKIRNRLNKAIENAIEWYPLIVSSKEKKKYKDYASKLYCATGAKFYKFTTGKYKTYFVLGVNCTYFADRIIQDTILKLFGTITPGTYFEYLEENYKIKGSFVVSRKIYSKDNRCIYD